MSGVLISRHVSKLRETKGKTIPIGLEVTLLSTQRKARNNAFPEAGLEDVRIHRSTQSTECTEGQNSF